MNVVIVEDEALAAERLANQIEKYDPAITVRAVLTSVESAIAWLAHHEQPDVLFVDIQLSDGLCFEIFRAVLIKCPVIFTTSYDQYALEAFEVHSIDYLLKPIKYEKLVHSLNKLEELKKNLGKSGPTFNLEEIIEKISKKESAYKARFLVRNGTHIKAIKTEEIAYFYSDQKLSFLLSKTNQKFPVDYALDEIAEMLDPRFFFRVNRKFIIHIDAAKEIHPYFKGRLKIELVPPTDEEIIISSDRTPLFKKWLDQ